MGDFQTRATLGEREVWGNFWKFLIVEQFAGCHKRGAVVDKEVETFLKAFPKSFEGTDLEIFELFN